ncbi:hypothetical protein [Pseudodonghicola xiamenensis]|uniref:ABC transporter permease subunit n=1 Tax=Pseudodonghicola xiamenensis TaxID=337702 RepID=A0A8J3MCU0_9RHOB|nr:hypothetical protein [Pseudodonghicola xiamenensis]GHG79525.1 hypothetical protein GCM10010961_01660 [Pseudodonghicola xiamenensis]
MSTLLDLLRSGYPGDLAAAMVVNFRIAGLALVMGLALGLPLAVGLAGGRGWRRIIAPVLGVMRAAPTFVVMFYLLNVIPHDLSLAGIDLAPSGPMIVALSLVPYAAAYGADNGGEALSSFRRGSVEGALLFLPNIVRAFFVLVMSSSTGAAIGVSEGVAVVLREADRWPQLGDKLIVFAIGVFAFGLVFQSGFALIRLAVHRIGRRHRRAAGSA